MASLTINSGEFPLLRNVDVSHQPNRAHVYGEWSRLVHHELQEIIEHLPEVIEDVLAYRVWEDKYLDSPEQYFEQYLGLFGLDLKEPAKLIDELRKAGPSKKKQDLLKRAEQARQLREAGQTQQQIAEALGVSQQTASRDLLKKSFRTEKMSKQQRQLIRYEINQGTDPHDAVEKMLQKFGEEWFGKMTDLANQKLEQIRKEL